MKLEKSSLDWIPWTGRALGKQIPHPAEFVSHPN